MDSSCDAHTDIYTPPLSNLGPQSGSECDSGDCFEVGDIILETSTSNDQEKEQDKEEGRIYRLLRVVEMNGKGLYLSNVQAVLAKKFKLDLDPRPLTRAEPFFIINKKSGVRVTRTYSWMSKI